MRSAAAAVAYLSAADYFATSPGELLGKGFEHLDIQNKLPSDVMECLCHNIDPATGEVLRPRAKDGDRVGADFTFSAPKSVSLARELGGEGNAGDPRVEAAHREAVAYAAGLIEQDMQTRVRIGGANDNRVTGNMVAYRVTHRDTRTNPEDGKPDPQLHDHFFVLNMTFDPVEEKWKAAEIADIKHDAPFYEAAYHNRLASNLKALGYGIERKGKGFEIAGVGKELNDKFSRRTKLIEEVAKKLGIKNPKSKAKLGATTRQGKTKEASDDLNAYYVSRLTDTEKFRLATLEGKPSREVSAEDAVAYAIGHHFERRSVEEEKKVYETALRYGVGSVTVQAVQEEAKRQGLLVKGDQATTRAVLAEEGRIIAFARNGRGTCGGMGIGQQVAPVLNLPHQPSIDEPRPDTATLFPEPQAGMTRLYHGAATAEPITEARWFSSDRRYAEGYALKSGGPKGVVFFVDLPTGHPLIEPEWPDQSIARGFHRNVELPRELAAQAVPERTGDLATNLLPNGKLSPEQQALSRHVLTSRDRVILIRGAAGTGKTTTMRHTIDRIDRPVVVLAPSADASRGVLRKEGFAEADTVAAFLRSKEMQGKARDGVIWVDEAALMPIRDTAALFEKAGELNARVVLQGDPRQHRSVAREGNLFHLLQRYAGLPVAELTDIRRQKGRYKEAVGAIERGDILKGHDILTELGWIQQTEGNAAVVEDYFAAKDAGKSVLLISPTHAQGDEITEAIRQKMTERGELKREREVPVLESTQWTDAEKTDFENYDGSEVVFWHTNGGSFKAGQQVAVADFKPGQSLGKPSNFTVFRPATKNLAVGDTIRITQTGWTADKKHRLNNGARYQVAGFEKNGGIRLNNGWVMAPDFGHFAHGYVSTSFSGQGKTVDRVLVAMGKQSQRAVNAEQFYVSASRATEKATIYTDQTPGELREGIQRRDERKSATELMHRQERSRLQRLLQRGRDYYRALRERYGRDNQPEKVRKRTYGR